MLYALTRVDISSSLSYSIGFSSFRSVEDIFSPISVRGLKMAFTMVVLSNMVVISRMMKMLMIMALYRNASCRNA